MWVRYAAEWGTTYHAGGYSSVPKSAFDAGVGGQNPCMTVTQSRERTRGEGLDPMASTEETRKRRKRPASAARSDEFYAAHEEQGALDQYLREVSKHALL